MVVKCATTTMVGLMRRGDLFRMIDGTVMRFNYVCYGNKRAMCSSLNGRKVRQISVHAFYSLCDKQGNLL